MVQQLLSLTPVNLLTFLSFLRFFFSSSDMRFSLALLSLRSCVSRRWSSRSLASICSTCALSTSFSLLGTWEEAGEERGRREDIRGSVAGDRM